MINRDELGELKNTEKFPLEEWDERGLNPSSETVRLDMNKDVNGFIDHILSIENSTQRENVVSGIQVYVDQWDRNGFDTEEMEYIFDVMADIIRKVGLRLDEIQIV